MAVLPFKLAVRPFIASTECNLQEALACRSAKKLSPGVRAGAASATPSTRHASKVLASKCQKLGQQLSTPTHAQNKLLKHGTMFFCLCNSPAPPPGAFSYEVSPTASFCRLNFTLRQHSAPCPVSPATPWPSILSSPPFTPAAGPPAARTPACAPMAAGKQGGG